MERVVANQLIEHLRKHSLYNPHQSAYREGHGTGTALLPIKSDIDMALDGGDGVVLVLLGLSAAFDAIDHAVLLQRLELCCGISDFALSWLSLLLAGCSQSVLNGNSCSSPTGLSIGMPQGSVLGPLLFSISTSRRWVKSCATIEAGHLTSLGPQTNHQCVTIVNIRHIAFTRATTVLTANFYCYHEHYHVGVRPLYGVRYHGYADDTQAYSRFSFRAARGNSPPYTVHVETCVEEICQCVSLNKLMLIGGRTEFMMIVPCHRQPAVERVQLVLCVGDAALKPERVVRNLGTMFDSHTTMLPTSTSWYAPATSICRLSVGSGPTLSRKPAVLQ